MTHFCGNQETYMSLNINLQDLYPIAFASSAFKDKFIFSPTGYFINFLL
jgi:hypothetical protein